MEFRYNWRSTSADHRIQDNARNARSPRRLAQGKVLVVLSFVLTLVSAVHAQQQKPDAEESESLVKAVQNPVASLISVPIQENVNPNIGPFDRTQTVLNIQPVIPIRIAKNWNLIARVITPLVQQPDVTQKSAGVYGLGDINPSFFFSPVKVNKLIWGVGPAIVLPTATNRFLGQGKWSLGPSVVALVQPAHWTIGALVNNVWSAGGQSRRPDVNQMLLQYFINYNLEKGWYLTSSPIITANWNASSGNRWVVPVGGGVGRVFRLGFQPVNVSLAFFGNAARPSTPPSSPWGVRFQVAFLYPKREK
jgi:hypothetical protein